MSTLRRMRAAISTYRAVQACWTTKGTMIDWQRDHPEAWPIVSRYFSLKAEVEKDAKHARS